MEQRNKGLFMMISLCCLLMVSCFPSSREGKFSLIYPENTRHALSRVGRGVYEFGLMIMCLTNRTALEYADYGCWCGLGGSGHPVDKLDSCCQVHDQCYDKIIKSGLCGYSWQVYLRRYKYSSCTKCDPLSNYPSDDQYALCRTKLCECDSAATICFNNSHFNPENIDYDTTKCV